MSLRDDAIKAMGSAVVSMPKGGDAMTAALDGLLGFLKERRHAITLAFYLKRPYVDAARFEMKEEWWGVVADHYARGVNAVTDQLGKQ